MAKHRTTFAFLIQKIKRPLGRNEYRSIDHLYTRNCVTCILRAFPYVMLLCLYFERVKNMSKIARKNRVFVIKGKSDRNDAIFFTIQRVI